MTEPGPFESGRYDPTPPSGSPSTPSLDKTQQQYTPQQQYPAQPQYPAQQQYPAQPQYPTEQYPAQSEQPSAQPNQQAPTQQYPSGQYQVPPPPPSNAGWAVAAILFFWPVAFSAFTHALNVYPKWAMGDYQGAQYASDRAKQLGKISMWIFVIFFVVLILFYVVIVAAAVSSLNGVS